MTALIMPTLRELMAFLCDCAAQSGHSFSEDLAGELERQIRRQYPSERVYIPPADSRKDPSQAEAIRKAAARLPTGVVAQRFGVSRQYVNRIYKKR